MIRANPALPRIRPAGLVIAAAVAAHAWVVFTVLVQPLPAGPNDAHFTTWPLHLDSVRRMGPAADFFAVYHGGVQAARHESVYATDEAPPRRTPYYFFFRYLPVVAQTLGRGAQLLSPQAAYHAWVIVLEALLATLLVVAWRAMPPGRLRVGSSVVLLLATPYFLELHMGQFTFAAGALACIAVLLLEGGRPPRRAVRLLVASLLFTAGVLLKIFPLLAVPALLRRRAGWAPAAVAVVAVVVSNVGYFAADPAAWERFRDFNIDATSGQQPGNHGLVRLVVVATRDVGFEWTDTRLARATLAWRGLILGGLSLLVLLAREAPLAVGAATMLLAQFVTYPQVWEHHASATLTAALLLACGLAARPAGGSPPTRLLGLVFAGMVALALPTPFAWLGRRPSLWPDYGRYLLPASKAVPTLALLCLGIYVLARSGLRPAGLRPSEPPASSGSTR